MIKKTLLFIFDAHVPYIPHEGETDRFEIASFYEMVSYGFLPFLRMCARLDAEGIPFKCALVISPLLCEMLNSQSLQERYCDYLNRHISFAAQEFNRLDSSLHTVIRLHLCALTRNRDDFINIHKKNILQAINAFAAKGHVELLATSATPCFFPFYQNMPEALAAQIELGLSSFREDFAAAPAGFWFPAMGYNTGLDRLIKSYGIDYTILESQSFLFADRPPAHGIFSSAMSENGLAFLGKDSNACAEITHPEAGFYKTPVYLDTDKDVGFELEENALSSLFDVGKGRRTTGFCYYGKNGSRYDIDAATLQAKKDAEQFIANRRSVLFEAAELLDTESLCSVSVVPLRFLGKTWFEGMYWLDSVFRNLAQSQDMSCCLPHEYLKQMRRIQSITPFYASSLPSGYADELLNSSNDWMFPRIQKATERMIDLAGRFPNDQGLKARTLNMAAKEVLLAQSMDWPLMADAQISSDYAAEQCEEHIKAFTAVYESLGAGMIGTDRLIKREKEYPIFSEMNYRFFIRRT